MHIWEGLEIIAQKYAKLNIFAISELNISPRPYRHMHFLNELSYLDPKLAQNIKKLVCICRRGQKMCFKNGKFQKVYLQNRGGPGNAHIAKKYFFYKVFPKGLIITNQLENPCALLKNSLNQVSKLVEIPIIPYFIYRKLCNDRGRLYEGLSANLGVQSRFWSSWGPIARIKNNFWKK